MCMCRADDESHTLSHRAVNATVRCACAHVIKATDDTITEIIIKHTRTDTNINTIKMRRQIQKFQTRRNFMKWINSCVCRSVFGMAAVGEKKTQQHPRFSIILSLPILFVECVADTTMQVRKLASCHGQCARATMTTLR